MIKKGTLDFLINLKENNNREWFQTHKNLYEEAKKDIEDNLSYLIIAVSSFDPSITDLEVKDVLFRIYRDIRFSKDKSPYKPYFGALITKNGKSNMEGSGYYFHIEPGNSMICGGVFHPEPKKLDKIREKINSNFTSYTEVINQPALRRYYGEIQGEKLKNVPRGFDKESPAAEILKLKQYIFMSKFSDEEIFSEDFLKETVKRMEAVKEFNEFLMV